jgi:ferrochelatase
MKHGVLLLAHGTPDSLGDMTEYLTRVRNGRVPSPELVAEMTHN